MKNFIRGKVVSALRRAREKGLVSEITDYGPIVIEAPKDPNHGDAASNAALVLAKAQKMPPRALAQLIIDHLDNQEGYLKKVALAGPGFINFTLAESYWRARVAEALERGPEYGSSDWGRAKKVQVEYVSANPTGPLHVGHGRGAALGDALARILAFAGCQVECEYYINDAGRQMETLGLSVYARMRERAGLEADFKDTYYQGRYIAELAARALAERGPGWLKSTGPEEAAALIGAWAGDLILEGIKRDLADFGVTHHRWFSEKSLYQRNLVEQALADLERRGRLYDRDGARWFASSALGDDKDRVLIKSGGEPTYFTADIAYHRDKFERGFNLAINILGADHHGYVPRLKAAVEALGYNRDQLQVILVQLVSLSRGGQPVSMSTRAGEFVTLREVLDEVGSDAARFIFLTRSPDAPLDFDLELAKSQSKDNPVYYIQYLAARIHSVLSQAAAERPDGASPPDLNRLAEPEETALMKHLALFPETVLGAARNLEPHRLSGYLTNLARLFHSYYNRHRIRVDDRELAQARLALVRAVRQVAETGLGLLGVKAPEKM